MTQQLVAGPEKLHDLQSLRGIAAVLVMLYHGGTLFSSMTGTPLFGNLFSAGFVGVDVFFVISGFIILWVHHKDIGQSDRVAPFAVKRALRLLPLYWIIVILKSVKDHQNFDWLVLLCALLLIPYPFPPYINVSWTLSLELLFYFLFAALLAIRTKYLASIAVAVLILMATIPAPFVGSGIPAVDVANFFFDQHLIGFAFGVLVAWLLKKFPVQYATLTLCVGLAFWCFAYVSVTSHGMAYNGVTKGHFAVSFTSIWFGIPTALIIYGLVGRALQHQRPVTSFLSYLGDSSYSLYLIHGFVIHQALNLTVFRAYATKYPSLIFIPMLLALAMASASYRFVEKPCVAIGKRFT